MRLRPPLAAALPLLLATAVLAAQSVTADDMREAEDTLHNLDSHISLQDKKALDDAKELARYFQQVEGHFSAKADAARGVAWTSRASRRRMPTPSPGTWRPATTTPPWTP